MVVWMMMMSMLPAADSVPKRYLIIHADDAGMSHSVNRGTIQAMEDGFVSSASIMVPCPWFPEFAQYAREHPELDYGIHLTLNAEWDQYRWGPVAGAARVPSLVDERGFLWDNVAQVAAHAKLEEAEIELRAQIERAREFGVPLSHLDTHMGACFSRPDLAQLYVRLAHDYNLPVLAVRPTRENGIDRSFPEAARIVSSLEQASLPILDAVYQFYERGSYEQRRQRYIDTLVELPQGVSEIIIHCGFDDPELQAITSSVDIRDSDRRIFLDPQVKRAMEQQQIEVITWKRFHQLVTEKAGQ